MENERMIPLQNICTHYNIQISFIQSLSEFGLVEIVKVEDNDCIDLEYLGEIETLMRLHYDLEINMEGIDAISHLLNRMKEMQRELNSLKNKLNMR